MIEIPAWILDAVGLDTPRFMYCIVAVTAGAYLKGYTGFGASMLWMTSLSLHRHEFHGNWNYELNPR